MPETNPSDISPEDDKHQAANQPAYWAGSFVCPHCGVLTGQRWLPGYQVRNFFGLQLAQCQSQDCQDFTLWMGRPAIGSGPVIRDFNDDEAHGFQRMWGEQGSGRFRPGVVAAQMIWPPTNPLGPSPSPDLPKAAVRDFEEARRTISVSPRGACALARLALQKLCDELVGSPGKIDANIKTLVAQGLPVRIQQALDFVRVMGNEAVHPGELVLEDDAATATSLLEMINLIVDNRISEPKRIQESFDRLPQTKRDGITNRDKNAPPPTP